MVLNYLIAWKYCTSVTTRTISFAIFLDNFCQPKHFDEAYSTAKYYNSLSSSTERNQRHLSGKMLAIYHVKTTFWYDFSGLIFISGVRMRNREPVPVASQRGLYGPFFYLFLAQRHKLWRFHYKAWMEDWPSCKPVFLWLSLETSGNNPCSSISCYNVQKINSIQPLCFILSVG